MARDLKLFSFARGTGLIQDVSDEFVQLIGLPAEQLIERPVSDVITPCGPVGTADSISWRDPKPGLSESRLHPAGEEALPLRLIIRPDQAEGLWQVAGIDVGGMIDLVMARRELRSRLSLVIKDSHMTMWRYDFARDQLVWESQASHVLGTPERDLPTDLATLLSWAPERQLGTVRDTVARIGDVGSGQCEIVIPDELQDRNLVLRGRVWDRAPDGTSRRAVGVIEDVTAEYELEKQRLAIAAVDPVTGLGNRRAFDRALREEMRRARSDGSSVSVLLIFIDGFGRFAGQVGSAIADQALVTIGQTLAVKDELLYRFDGASFATIVRGGGSAGVEQLMHVLLERTATIELRQALGHSFAVTAGCASWDGEVELRSAELLRRAERALHRAQEDGGARGYTYESSIIGLEELREGVASGIATGEFVLHYQPQIRLSDERIVGLQATARWNRPSGETLEPSAFMPAINSSDIARDFGRWVLTQATHQLALWDRDERLCEVWVNVDLTPEHAGHPRLSDDIAQAVTDSGIDPRRLAIGIPAALIRAPRADYELLRDIRQLGVRVFVNDLEPGEFRFPELASVPVDLVKIHERFMSDQQPSRYGLGELIIEAAHRCGLMIAAVAVGTAVTQFGVTQLSCDLGQGDYIATPMTADAAAAYVRSLTVPVVSSPAG